MKVCIVTDEISADPETAIELGVDWGVKDFELRGYYYDRVPEISNHQRQRLHETLDQYDARCCCQPRLILSFRSPGPIRRVSRCHGSIAYFMTSGRTLSAE